MFTLRDSRGGLGGPYTPQQHTRNLRNLVKFKFIPYKRKVKKSVEEAI